MQMQLIAQAVIPGDFEPHLLTCWDCVCAEAMMDGAAVTGGRRGEEFIKVNMEACKDVKIARPDGTPGLSLKRAQCKEGAQWGEAVVGQQVEMFWPDDAKYYKAELTRYSKATGYHQVKAGCMATRCSAGCCCLG